MSVYVDEIIRDLKDYKEDYDDIGYGVSKGLLRIQGYGNAPLLSCIEVLLGGEEVPLSYIDRFRLELAVKRWYRAVPLDVLLKNK